MTKFLNPTSIKASSSEAAGDPRIRRFVCGGSPAAASVGFGARPFVARPRLLRISSQVAEALLS
jgi:hypothetical protein